MRRLIVLIVKSIRNMIVILLINTFRYETYTRTLLFALHYCGVVNENKTVVMLCRHFNIKFFFIAASEIE